MSGLTLNPAQADKSGYPHFMLKEIHEQPRVLADTLRNRVKDNRVDFSDTKLAEFFTDVKRYLL